MKINLASYPVRTIKSYYEDPDDRELFALNLTCGHMRFIYKAELPSRMKIGCPLCSPKGGIL